MLSKSESIYRHGGMHKKIVGFDRCVIKDSKNNFVHVPRTRTIIDSGEYKGMEISPLDKTQKIFPTINDDATIFYLPIDRDNKNIANEKMRALIKSGFETEYLSFPYSVYSLEEGKM